VLAEGRPAAEVSQRDPEEIYHTTQFLQKYHLTYFLE
jgi:hypothetical protein